MNISNKKSTLLIGILVFILLLVGCKAKPNQNRLTPEDTLDNYMEEIKTGNILKSHDYIHGTLYESFTSSEDNEFILGDAWQDRIKNLEGYQQYLKELSHLYGEIDYSITGTHKREGFNQKEFDITVTGPDFNILNNELLPDIAETFFMEITYSDSEDTMLEVYNRMYNEFAKYISNSNHSTDEVSGHIVITSDNTDNKIPEGEWIISSMDYDLFNLLANQKDI